MKTLRPIYDFDSYSASMEKEIYAQLFSYIFAPLYEILSKKEVRNERTTQLEEALRTGKLQYVNGFFVGSLTARISKELRGIGATYNRTRKAYKLERSNLPQDIVLAISEGNLKAKEQLRKVEDFLSAIEGRKMKPLELSALFGDTFDKLDKQFHSTTRAVTGKDISIPLAERFKEQLSEAYTKNLDLYIQDWHDTQVLKLRQQVSKNVQAGFRAEKLIETIQHEQGVTARKAKFLARQETSLMVSKYRQIRYEEVGLNKYLWSTSHDQRVRPDHKHLQGKVFRFDQPPVTDLHTMARNNPGEDYNCRCVAIPVLTTREVLEGEYAGV